MDGEFALTTENSEPDPSHSVTFWFHQLSLGDQNAAGELWKRFGPALERLSRERFGFAFNAVAGGDDLVQSVFFTLWSGAKAGAFDGVSNRDELWWLLIHLARTKALNLARRNRTQRRGGHVNQLGQAAANSHEHDESIDHVPDNRESPPELIVSLRDQLDQALTLLPDDDFRRIALLKLEGHTNEEIADRIGVVKRTIIRKLNLVREKWSTIQAD